MTTSIHPIRTTRFDVAVFPIPDAVLFPGTTLPLHIFEERYGRMLADLRAKGWPLAISLVEPEPSSAHEYRLNTICGAGSVQIFKEYGDGRSDILVHGTQRVKLLSFVQREPYLIMEAEAIDDATSVKISPEGLLTGEALIKGGGAGGLSGRESGGPDFAALQDFEDAEELEELRLMIQAWAFLNPDVPDELSVAFDDLIRVGELSDFFVFHFIRKVAEKQRYLNCSDPHERADRLFQYLRKDLIRQSRRQLKVKQGMLMH